MNRCAPCRDRRHGEACPGCDCRCRAMLGLDLFEGGPDQTVISWDVGNPDNDDQAGQVA